MPRRATGGTYQSYRGETEQRNARPNSLTAASEYGSSAQLPRLEAWVYLATWIAALMYSLIEMYRASVGKDYGCRYLIYSAYKHNTSSFLHI